MVANNSPDNPVSARDVAQKASAIVLTGTALCFALGLLIVNLRLARYGYFSADFIRTEYVLAGGLFVFLVAIATFFVSYGISHFSAATERWRAKEHLVAVLAILFGLFEILAVPSFALSTTSEWRLFARQLAHLALHPGIGAIRTGRSPLHSAVHSCAYSPFCRCHS